MHHPTMVTCLLTFAVNPIAVGAELDHLSARNGHAFLAEEHHGCEHQNRRVDEEGEVRATIESIVSKRITALQEPSCPKPAIQFCC